VAMLARVAEPAAPMVASLGALVEALTMTTVAFPLSSLQEPEPGVAEPVLPVVVQVERSPPAGGAVAKHNLRRVRWVDDEAGAASRKASVVEVVSSSPPRFPAVIPVLWWLWLLGGEDPIVMLVILVLLESAVVDIGRGVAGAISLCWVSFVVFA